ncbi:MAG: DNA translocase FtsK [Kiritimatiellae bacterium]|nr:DNA translocase FtsK [Kiritimatiellia bacterium]MDW8458662.1 DNA translocase FtsK [Verrucomicrobiota bacterium]
MALKKTTSPSGWLEAYGIVLLTLAMLSLLAILSYEPGDLPVFQAPPNDPPHNFIGPVGAWFAFILLMGFGLAAYGAPAVLLYDSLVCLLKREGRIWTKQLWSWVLLGAVAALLELWDLGEAKRLDLNITSPGGVVGEILTTRSLIYMWGPIGTGILMGGLAAISLVFMLEIRLVAVARHLWDIFVEIAERLREARRARMDRLRQLEEEQRELAKRRRRLEEAMRPTESTPVVRVRSKASELEPAPIQVKTATESKDEAEVDEVEPAEPAVSATTEDEVLSPRTESPAVAPERPPVRKSDRSAAAETATKLETQDQPPTALSPAGGASWVLPPIDLLEKVTGHPELASADVQAGGRLLKETLAEFGVEVDITNVERGPVVTRYELLPAPGVRVERITALSNNIALAMKAETVRVQAPIPGKGVVGIEVPNLKSTAVYLREIIESDVWQSGKFALPLCLGKDVGGRVQVADLAEMPHLLIAGATGSGKTVCMNTILTGLLMSRTPDQLRLMLVDPKIVEFSNYNHLPHLVVPVITDPKKVALGLRWAINEMERRYKLFARVGVRNIKAFNSRPQQKQAELFPEEQSAADAPQDVIPDRLPYIVIVVDELADLMMVAQAEIENQIARLAQLSRAVGIHMILATQRPSVNVITGTIKANFPARISFQVAQKVDSRTILDAAGADKLLGKGDMLFLPPGSPKLIRAQGAYTTDAEINRVIEFWKKQGVPQYESSIREKIEGKQVELPDMEEDDELLEQAIEIIRQTRRASTSSLQRRLRIGYTRAARIMDLLEQKGIVGPAQGADPREILIDLDGEIPGNPPEPKA